MLSRLTNSLWMQQEAAAAAEEHPQHQQQEQQHHHTITNSFMAPPPPPPQLTTALLDDDDDWYFDTNTITNQIQPDPKASTTTFVSNHLFLPTTASSSNSSCSNNNNNNNNSSLFPLNPLLNGTNPFDAGFDLAGIDTSGLLGNNTGSHISNSPLSLLGSGNGIGGNTSCGFLAGFGNFGNNNNNISEQLSFPELSTGAQFNNLGFDVLDNSAPFVARSKMLRPLEIFPPVGAQPTLFQKRALLRQNSASGRGNVDDDDERRRRKGSEEVEEVEDMGSIDVSGLHYDSDDMAGMENSKEEEESAGRMNNISNGRGGKGSNANSAVTGVSGGGDGGKGKKKGLPAKNLMAERRRRKKLNDRLYMLRSVVPKISKMDRASILGDAIEYLKELLQKINDLHNELESTPSSSSLPPTPTSFHPLTPTLPTLPSHVKEELCPNALSSPNGQPARVEVRLREGRAVNIHMFCGRRPGLLLSTMRALDGLGLDVQQAVISCFNGFALDVFRAEQCKEGPGLLPEEIKAVLLQSAGFHTVI